MWCVEQRVNLIDYIARFGKFETLECIENSDGSQETSKNIKTKNVHTRIHTHTHTQYIYI